MHFNKIKYYNYFILFIIILVLSCSDNNEPNKKVRLAKIYGNVLYSDDVDFNQWDSLSEKDRSTIKTLYIEHWLKDQILLHNTEIESEEKEAIEKLTDDYRNVLIIDLIKNKIAKINLDTSIGEAEYNKYYKTIKSSFRAEEDFVNYRLMILDVKNKNTEKIKKIWNQGEYEKIMDFNISNNEVLELNSDNWIARTDLKKKLPSQLILNTDKYSISKKIDNYNYFLKLDKTVRKNDILPLQIVKTRIREMILNKRKSDIIDNYILEIYKKESDNIKIYD